MRGFAIAFFSLLFVAGAARAGDSAPPVTDWTTELVVVTADTGGPAMWRIKQGDSEIWILPTVGLMPEKTAWNATHLAQTIEGANAVFLPPEAKADIFDFIGMSWFLLMHREALSMPGDQKLEDSLAPDLRPRFVAARMAVKKDAGEFEDDSPMLAGFKLLGFYTEANKLTGDVPDRAAEKIAHDKHVKVRRIAEYSAVPLIKEMMKLPPGAGRVCFATALKVYETWNAHQLAAAEAWAVGDVAGIRANYSGGQFQDCVSQGHKFGEIDDRAVSDTMKAIHEALAKPGKTVMLLDIGWLFRSGGVADKLKAEGMTIEQQ